MIKRLLTFSITCLLIPFFISSVQAEQMKKFGPYNVHYSVFNTSFLEPQIAKVYGITRADNQALVNIAIRSDQGGNDHAVEAEISGTVSDLIHQTPLEFKAVHEDGAIYYLATARISNKEQVHFTILVLPMDPQSTVKSKTPYELKFSKTLYTE